MSFRQPQTNSRFDKKNLSRDCQMQSVKVWWKNFLIMNNAVSSLKIANSFSKFTWKKPKIFQIDFSLVFFEYFFNILGRYMLRNTFAKWFLPKMDKFKQFIKRPQPAKLQVSQPLETKPPWPKNIGQTNNIFRNNIPNLCNIRILNLRNI